MGVAHVWLVRPVEGLDGVGEMPECQSGSSIDPQKAHWNDICGDSDVPGVGGFTKWWFESVLRVKNAGQCLGTGSQSCCYFINFCLSVGWGALVPWIESTSHLDIQHEQAAPISITRGFIQPSFWPWWMQTTTLWLLGTCLYIQLASWLFVLDVCGSSKKGLKDMKDDIYWKI